MMEPTLEAAPTVAEETKHTLQKATLIVNTRSRQGKAAYESVVNVLREKFDLVEAHALKKPGMAPILAEKAIKAGVPLVIVGGGDGTLSACVPPFIGTDAVMGTLPLGTGNQFVRDLGLPINVIAACNALAEGKIASVDVGRINKKLFLTVATIGLTTHIAQELTADAKRRWGILVYGLVLMRALRKTHPFEITIKTGGDVKTFSSLQAVIGNGRLHGGSFPLAPDATITDGKLVIYALNSTNKWSLLRYALNLPGGKHVYLEEIPTFENSSGEITTRPVQKVTIDGETKISTPVSFDVLPKALRVIVPLDFAG